jgi:hypothetical protein
MLLLKGNVGVVYHARKLYCETKPKNDINVPLRMVHPPFFLLLWRFGSVSVSLVPRPSTCGHFGRGFD